MLLKKTRNYYARAAAIYRPLRITDSEPVLHIKGIIGDKEKIKDPLRSSGKTSANPDKDPDKINWFDEKIMCTVLRKQLG